MRHAAWIVMLLLVAAPALGMTPAPPATVLNVRDGTVTIDVGSAKGVKVGMKLMLYRHVRFVAYLKIASVEEHLASGHVVESVLDPRRGDKVIIEDAGRSVSALSGAGKGDAQRRTLLQRAREREFGKHLAEGKRLFRAGDHEDARISFEKALALDPDNAEAQALRDRCKQVVDLIRRLEMPRIGHRHRFTMQIANLMIDKVMDRAWALAKKAKTEADLDASSEQLRVARGVLEDNRDIYTPEGLAEARALLARFESAVAATRAAWKKGKTGTEWIQMEKARIDLAEMLDRDEDRKYAELTMRVEKLIRTAWYRQADEELQRIIAVSPRIRWALRKRKKLAELFALMDPKGVVKEDANRTKEQKPGGERAIEETDAESDFRARGGAPPLNVERTTISKERNAR